MQSVELHHILFRSATQGALSEIIDDPDGCVLLCSKHHREGPESPHKARKWKEYYYRLLPDRLLDLVANKGLVRHIKNINRKSTKNPLF
jgi:hypothetical protein